MKTKTFLLGAAVGLISGVALALSTAPQSGTQLRQNLARQTDYTKSELLAVKSDVSQVKHSIFALTNEAKNNIPQIINELKDSFSNFKQDIEPNTVHLKQEIENLQKSIDEIEKNIPKNEKNQ